MWRSGEEQKCTQGFGGETVTDHLEDRGVDGIIILKLILKPAARQWAILMWLRLGTNGELM